MKKIKSILEFIFQKPFKSHIKAMFFQTYVYIWWHIYAVSQTKGYVFLKWTAGVMLKY